MMFKASFLHIRKTNYKVLWLGSFKKKRNQFSYESVISLKLKVRLAPHLTDVAYRPFGAANESLRNISPAWYCCCIPYSIKFIIKAALGIKSYVFSE
jgi:hypothetical protein